MSRLNYKCIVVASVPGLCGYHNAYVKIEPVARSPIKLVILTTLQPPYDKVLQRVSQLLHLRYEITPPRGYNALRGLALFTK